MRVWCNGNIPISSLGAPSSILGPASMKGERLTKKLICVILCLSLMLSVASAAGVYEVEEDTHIRIWPSAYAISTLEFTESDSGTLDACRELLNYIWNDMRAGFEFVDDSIIAGNTTLTEIKTVLDGSDTTLDYILQGVGQTNGYLQITNSKLDDVNGSVGLVNGSVQAFQTALLNALRLASGSTYLNSTGGNSTSTSAFNLPTFLNSGIRGLASLMRSESGDSVLLSSGVSGTLSSYAGVEYVLRNGLLGLSSLVRAESGESYLNASGVSASLASAAGLDSINRTGFLGLSSLLRADAGDSVLLSSGISGTLTGYAGAEYILRNGFLGLHEVMSLDADQTVLLANGQSGTTTGVYGMDRLLQGGFLGLRSLISGSETDNVYQGTSINNENEKSSVSATGLGPMLNTWLGDIQNDLGLLSYVFASPQDLEIKKTSESNMDSVNDNFLKSDSKSGLKVSQIGDISSASESIQGFGDTGVTPGQAFSQLGNADLFRFFSAETAADLDTTVSTYSRDPSTQIVTSYYEDSRSEFYEIIAGEGNDG